MQSLFDGWTHLFCPDWHWRTSKVNTIKSLRIISNQIDRTQFVCSEFYSFLAYEIVTMSYESIEMRGRKWK